MPARSVSPDGLSNSVNGSAHSSRVGSSSSNGDGFVANGSFSGPNSGVFGDKVLLHPGSDLPSDAEAAALGLELSNGSPIVGVARAEADAATDSHAVAYSSLGSSVFVLSATTLGAGILALPYAMATLGWLFGSLLLLAVGLASSYSINLLLVTAASVGATTYEELGHALFPRFGRRLVVACTLVLIFGSLTAFFVIIGDTLGPAMQSIVHNDTNFFMQKKVLLVIAAIVLVYPLCLLRSIHALERWSFLAVGIILAFSVVVIVESGRALHAGTAAPAKDGSDPSLSRHFELFQGSTSLFEALPIICLAFTCQTMVFPIWNALIGGSGHPPSQRETGLAPAKSMWSVVNRALLLCGSLYLLVGCFGYALFGASTKGDVLNNFATNKPFWDTVRLLFTMAICIHYPVVHFGFRGAVLHTWFGGYTDAENNIRFHVLTVLTVLASLVLAIVLPDLSTVFSLTGALCAFPYCFMFPTLFFLRLHDPRARILYLRGPRANGIAQAAGGADTEANGGANGVSGSTNGPVTEDGSIGNGAVHDEEHGSAGAHGSFGTYQPLHNHDGADENEGPLGASIPKAQAAVVGLGARALTPSSTEAARWFRLPELSLARSKQIPAYALLATATVLWFVSIVVCFIDMVNTFKKDEK